MTQYPFNLVRPDQTEPLTDTALLRERPFTKQDRTFQADARRFVPSEAHDDGYQHGDRRG